MTRKHLICSKNSLVADQENLTKKRNELLLLLQLFYGPLDFVCNYLVEPAPEKEN